jgi:hypothetical protein
MFLALLDLAASQRESGKLPVSCVLVAPEDVQVPVICVNLEPALCGPKPAVNHATHGKSALAEPESAWFQFTAVADAALHTNHHGSRYS